MGSRTSLASAEAAKGFADEVTGGEGGVEAGEGFLRFGRFVAEGKEGEEGVLGVACKWGRGTFGGSTTCEGVECRKFIA